MDAQKVYCKYLTVCIFSTFVYYNYLNRQNLWREEIKPLMPYPWIYIATFVFPVINRCVRNYKQVLRLMHLGTCVNIFMVTMYVE